MLHGANAGAQDVIDVLWRRRDVAMNDARELDPLSVEGRLLGGAPDGCIGPRRLQVDPLTIAEDEERVTAIDGRRLLVLARVETPIESDESGPLPISLRELLGGAYRRRDGAWSHLGHLVGSRSQIRRPKSSVSGVAACPRKHGGCTKTNRRNFHIGFLAVTVMDRLHAGASFCAAREMSACRLA